MSRRTALLLLFALALLLTWAFVSTRGALGDSVDPTVTEAAPAADAGMEERSKAEEDGRPMRTQATAMEASDPRDLSSLAREPGRGIMLQVLRSEDSSPVPGAAVRWYRQGDAVRHPREREFLHDNFDREGFAELLCPQPLLADEAGKLILPAPSGEWLYVVGRSDGLWGSASLGGRASTDEANLMLHPEATVTVRVVDVDGRPVTGARVGWESESLGIERAPSLWQWMTTNQDGLAHIDQLSPEQLGEPPPRGMSRWIALLEPFEPRIRVRWDIEQPPQQPVVLQMPRYGSVNVEAADAVGGAAADGTQSFLQVASWGWMPGARGYGRMLTNGAFTYPYVGLGLELLAAADIQERGRYETTLGLGPSVAGESVTLRIAPNASGDVLTGRIVSRTGMPTDREWEISLAILLPDGDHRGTFSGRVRLRDDGGFTLAMRNEWRGFLGHAILMLAPEQTARGEFRAACAELAWPPRPGAVDLGDLTFGDDLLVAGRVEDAWGNAVAGLQIEPCRTLDGNDIHPLAGTIHSFALRSDEQGNFRFLGGWPASADQLRFRVGETVLLGPSFQQGQSNLIVVQEARSTVHGTLLIGSELNGLNLHLRARVVPTHGGGVEELQAQLRSDYSFSLVDVPAGELDLDLVSWHPPFELNGIARVTVGRVAMERPIEFNPVDLRGRLRFCTITARMPNGQFAAGARFQFESPNSPSFGRAYYLPAVFAVPVGYSGSATCLADGHSPAPIDWSLPLQEIDLEPLPMIRFRVAGLPMKAPEYNTVEVRMRHLGDSGGETWARTFTFETGPWLEAWVPEAGTYSVSLHLTQRVPGGSIAGAILSLSSETTLQIEIPAEGVGAELQLNVSPAALAEALKQLRAP